MRRLALAIVVLSGCSQAPEDPALVTVEQGTLRGVLDGEVVHWRGVPFATAERWTRPVPAPAWSGVRDAVELAPPCAQLDADTPTGTEDCLALDVDAPVARTEPLPVIVFVHGGSWLVGDSGAPVYHGAQLAKDAIVVTINYRLGALGFLSLPALAAEDPDGSTGNYGLHDQVAALSWVQRNIAAFGGDPNRVLVWGQSAGGYSALMLVASPLGRGLFASAFSQSGGVALRGLPRSQAIGAAYATALGCAATDVSCLRALPVERAQQPPPDVVPRYTWGPVIDGVALVEPVLVTIAAGRHAHVPVLLGTTLEEYRYPKALVAPPVSSVTTVVDYEAAVEQHFGTATAPAILARYPAAAYASPRAAYIAVLDDANRTCVARRTARALVMGQTEPVWRYLYAHTDSSGPQAAIGAAHGTDLPFWFDNFVTFAPTASELALAGTMSDAVRSLARAGTLDASWPRYDAADPYLELDDATVSKAGLHAGACDFWDGLADD